MERFECQIRMVKFIRNYIGTYNTLHTFKCSAILIQSAIKTLGRFAKKNTLDAFGSVFTRISFRILKFNFFEKICFL